MSLLSIRGVYDTYVGLQYVLSCREFIDVYIRKVFIRDNTSSCWKNSNLVISKILDISKVSGLAILWFFWYKAYVVARFPELVYVCRVDLQSQSSEMISALSLASTLQHRIDPMIVNVTQRIGICFILRTHINLE